MIPHKYTAEEIIAAFERPANSSKQTNAQERKNPDQEEIRRALTCLDPSDREIWIKVGHELKSEGASLRELYLEWSRGDLSEIMPTNFVSEEDVCAKWDEFNPVRTSIEFLFKAAEKNGYEPPHSSYCLKRGTIVECAQ